MSADSKNTAVEGTNKYDAPASARSMDLEYRCTHSTSWTTKTVPKVPPGSKLCWRHDGPPNVATITIIERSWPQGIEYENWSDLFLIQPTGEIIQIHHPSVGNYTTLGPIRTKGPAHIPNPKHVVAWATYMNFVVDSTALDVLCTAWGVHSSQLHPSITLGPDCWREKVSPHVRSLEELTKGTVR